MVIGLADWKRYYGFARPLNFNVAVPFLLNVLGLVLGLIVCVALAMSGGLSIGTVRFYFFSYVLGLFLLAAVLSTIPGVSYLMFCWSITELALAYSSNTLENHVIDIAVLPENYAFSPDRNHPTGYIYHPLLQSALRPDWRSQSGAFFHNSLGMRGLELRAEDLKKDLIFVYGGSTTYDVGVKQGETWVERLQPRLTSDSIVLNFGVPGYSTTEHLVQTAFYQGDLGKRPVCAIYYIGWNDIINAHREHVDGGYADWMLLIQLRRARRPMPIVVAHSPVLRLMYAIARRTTNDLFPAMPTIKGKLVSASNARLERIYDEHVRMIAAINTSRGVKSIFIGQMLNRAKLTSERLSHTFPLTRAKDVWPLQERFNGILGNVATSHGAVYVDVGIENFVNSDFVDEGHFSAAGSEKFARLIHRPVEDHCRQDRSSGHIARSSGAERAGS